jgi:hypothetical protein
VVFKNQKKKKKKKLFDTSQLISVFVSVHPQQFLILVIYQQVIPALLSSFRTFTTIITIFVILAILTDLRFKDRRGS